MGTVVAAAAVVDAVGDVEGALEPYRTVDAVEGVLEPNRTVGGEGEGAVEYTLSSFVVFLSLNT